MTNNEYLKEVISGIKFRYKIKTQKEIIERMGYTSATNLSDMLNGNTPISDIFSEKLKEIFKVNPDFIRTGEGNIWIDENVSNSNNSNGNNSPQITGNDNQINHINNSTTLEKALDEISEMRKALTEALHINQDALRVNQENTARLLTIVEKMVLR